jgi:peptidoglycan-associated lipoprotein
MKMDRKWIILAALAVTVALAAGCASAPEPVAPPPPVVQTPPPVEVKEEPAPAPMADVPEQAPPLSVQDLQKKLEADGLIGDVYYDFDKYDLSASARERLAKNAEFMASPDGRDLKFTIEGHCDERGTNEYNLALGQKRTSTGLDYLLSLGVDRGRFKTISYGEERPFCTESNEGCWQRNRRARFVITGR